MENNAIEGNKMTCRTAQGVEIEADVLRLTRHVAAFEISGAHCSLQLSEVLNDFKIRINDRAVYSGQAVVASLVNTGGGAVCEATLDDTGLNEAVLSPMGDAGQIKAAFDVFLQNWGKTYKIRPDFKLLLADMQSYLFDLRLWLDQVEMGMGSQPGGAQAEHDLIRRLMVLTTPALSALFGKFEEAAGGIEEDLQPAHRAYCRRQLHPLLLCSPFMNRIYTKPLGYAGDYEMVNMILRDPCEGGSLYAKLLNSFILAQSPGAAHRNRVVYLTRKLIEETNRAFQKGKTARIFNIGCGPAGELQAFMREHPLSDHARVTLLDMNDETLADTGQILEAAKRKYNRRTSVELIKKSVRQLLKQNSRLKTGVPEAEYDFIYCAGLFDYLNDGACQALMDLFYRQLAPGGLLVATNVDSYNPIRNIMEYIFEWHLIYRNGGEFAALAPKAAPADAVTVLAEETSSNIFIDVRKPLAPP